MKRGTHHNMLQINFLSKLVPKNQIYGVTFIDIKFYASLLMCRKYVSKKSAGNF